MGGAIDLDAPPDLVGRRVRRGRASAERRRAARRRCRRPPRSTGSPIASSRSRSRSGPSRVIAGAIWAQEAWGRYWGWDPKETWSFITWTIFAGYLHARATSGWKGAQGRRRSRSSGFVALLDHVLRREPVDRRAALVREVMRSRVAGRRERSVVQCARSRAPRRARPRPHGGEETCGRRRSGSSGSLALDARCSPPARRTRRRTPSSPPVRPRRPRRTSSSPSSGSPSASS